MLVLRPSFLLVGSAYILFPLALAGSTFCATGFTFPLPSGAYILFPVALIGSTFCATGFTFPLPTGGSVIYVYLFPAHVLLDDLLVFDDVLPDPKLLLDHWLLVDYHLILNYRHRDLILADLRPGAFLIHRYSIDADLLALLRHPNLLALCSYRLADTHLTSFALARIGTKLFF